MALAHAFPWQPIDLSPLGPALRGSATHAIVKTHALELMRVVLLAGAALPAHQVYGECTLLCLEGEVEVQGDEGTPCRLGMGQLVLLPARARHAVMALRDSSLLVTIQLPEGQPGSASSTTTPLA
jgi:quercetin dioxygenase-like cupin family protein